MRLPKKTKWAWGEEREAREDRTRPRGGGVARSCLLNGATSRTPDEWTGGGADISTVIYHPARPARKPTGTLRGHGPRGRGEGEERGRKIEKEERHEKGTTRTRFARSPLLPPPSLYLPLTFSVLPTRGPTGFRANPHYHASRLPSHYLVIPISRSNFIRNPDTDIPPG